MSEGDSRAQIEAEFLRLDLRPENIPGGGLAFSGQEAIDGLLAHLRSLQKGATWRDVFPDTPAHWDVDDPDTWTMPEYCLGPFDFPDAPRGGAVFASLDLAADVAAGTAALERVASGDIPIYGSGLVLDRGHPHLFVVLPRGAPAAHLDEIANVLRQQPGLGNAYPYRFEAGTQHDS